MECSHNQRNRFTHGFYCKDCSKFFSKESAVYMSNEFLSTLWCALHNINAESICNGGPQINNVIAMRDKIGIGIKHDNYEDLIAEAEAMLSKYGTTADSAIMELKR